MPYPTITWTVVAVRRRRDQAVLCVRHVRDVQQPIDDVDPDEAYLDPLEVVTGQRALRRCLVLWRAKLQPPRPPKSEPRQPKQPKGPPVSAFLGIQRQPGEAVPYLPPDWALTPDPLPMLDPPPVAVTTAVRLRTALLSYAEIAQALGQPWTAGAVRHLVRIEFMR